MSHTKKPNRQIACPHCNTSTWYCVYWVDDSRNDAPPRLVQCGRSDYPGEEPPDGACGEFFAIQGVWAPTFHTFTLC